MYIQITTKCNMKCAHCGFACTRTGEHMPLNVFQKALSIAVSRNEAVTIGGGEPTMHPRFFEFLELVREEARRGNFEITPFMVTNGKATGKARRLLRILEREREILEPGERTIDARLSQDEWHEPIDRDVVARYARLGDKHRATALHTVQRIAPVGRGASQRFDWMREKWGAKCFCDTPLVDPQGRVWACGCKKHLLGSVWDCGVLDDYEEEFAHYGGREPNKEEAA